MTNKEQVYAQLLAGALSGALANPNNRLYDRKDIEKATNDAVYATNLAFAAFNKTHPRRKWFSDDKPEGENGTSLY